MPVSLATFCIDNNNENKWGTTLSEPGLWTLLQTTTKTDERQNSTLPVNPPLPALLFQPLDSHVPVGLFKWVPALHSARVLKSTRAEVFVCSISFIY